MNKYRLMNVELPYMNLIYTCPSIVFLMIIFFLNAPSYIDYIAAQSVSNSTTQNDTNITNSTTSELDTDLANKRLPLEAVLVTKNIAENEYRHDRFTFRKSSATRSKLDLCAGFSTTLWKYSTFQ